MASRKDMALRAFGDLQTDFLALGDYTKNVSVQFERAYTIVSRLDELLNGDQEVPPIATEYIDGTIEFGLTVLLELVLRLIDDKHPDDLLEICHDLIDLIEKGDTKHETSESTEG